MKKCVASCQGRIKDKEGFSQYWLICSSLLLTVSSLSMSRFIWQAFNQQANLLHRHLACCTPKSAQHPAIGPQLLPAVHNNVSSHVD